MTDYVYDASGTRVAKGSLSGLPTPSVSQPMTAAQYCNLETTGNFTLTNQYLLGPGGEQVTELNGSGSWKHTNIWAGSKLDATYDTKGLHFHLSDPLGTRRVQVAASGGTGGGVEAYFFSLPFGDALTPTYTSLSTADDATEHHFTGKERDTESGNDYFEARYYSSAMGRFMSPDWSAKAEPVPYAKLDDPQSLNLYAYVMNNPLNRTDPTGHWCLFGHGTTCTPLPPPPPAPKAPGLTGDAKKEFLSGLDSMKVGNKTVGQLAKTLHNESKGLTGGKPGELAKGKTAEANAIINNAEKAKPNAMAPSTGTAPAEDKQIMEEAVYNRATGGRRSS